MELRDGGLVEMIDYVSDPAAGMGAISRRVPARTLAGQISSFVPRPAVAGENAACLGVAFMRDPALWRLALAMRTEDARHAEGSYDDHLRAIASRDPSPAVRWAARSHLNGLHADRQRRRRVWARIDRSRACRGFRQRVAAPRRTRARARRRSTNSPRASRGSPRGDPDSGDPEPAGAAVAPGWSASQAAAQ